MSLKEIKKALIEASAVPWKIGTASPNGLQNVGTMKGVMVCQTFTIEDATLISNSPMWLASLVSKVEEMQKVLQQTRAGISNAYEFGYLKETDQNDVHNMIERINEVLKGESQ